MPRNQERHLGLPAGLVVRGIVDEEDGQEMVLDLAYRLAKRAYKFE